MTSRTPLAASLALATALLAGCGDSAAPAADAPAAGAAATLPAPPVAEKRDHAVVAPHGASRNDEYYWLRDDSRSAPDVLAYLEAENAYADAMLADIAPLTETLYQEIVGRIQPDDSSVPYSDGGWMYYTRYAEGQEYPIHARRQGTMDAPEQVMLDVNQLAAGQGFFAVGAWEVSEDGHLLAWAEDTSGRRQYTLKVKDLRTGEVLPDTITGASGSLVWANDGRSFFYVENDPVTLLSTRVKQHVLGTDPATDPVVYEEADTSFYMGVGRTTDDTHLCIGVGSTVSSEQRCTDAAAPGEWKVIAPRERDIEYSADRINGQWVITTNWNAPDWRIMTAPGDAFGSRDAWVELVPQAEGVFINGVQAFEGFLAISERSEGLMRIRIRPWQGEERFVDADEPAYTMGFGMNAEPGTDWLRYTYTSLTTPATTYELNVTTGERRMLKQQPVLGGFDASRYVTERLWATARDGTRIPVSLVRHVDTPVDGTAPMLQYAYGSYGSSTDPRFNAGLLSLLDRGVVYAIAHIRGGQEMGRAWYDQGRMMNKINTFTDFIDVTDFLVANGHAAPDRVAAYGGSAGGLLMGAIANMAPEKYDAIVAAVPFVDVVTTMLDESIPLTTNEFDEWGNPGGSEEAYAYMLSYSPYDQVKAQAYPAMLVTTGLHDSQVQYFEPAKWVARLRATATGDAPLILRTNMEAGHGGASGRFRAQREAAERYAFMLRELGVATTP
jgi:oligopeptidase B